MSSTEHDALVQELDALDRRIEAKACEVRTRGEFTEAQEGFVANLQKRQTEIRQKMDAQLREGVSWQLIETEFRRDFDGLFGELLRWEERLDAATTTSKTS
jgi:hypothetical protein